MSRINGGDSMGGGVGVSGARTGAGIQGKAGRNISSDYKAGSPGTTLPQQGLKTGNVKVKPSDPYSKVVTKLKPGSPSGATKPITFSPDKGNARGLKAANKGK